MNSIRPGTDRRAFLKTIAGIGGAFALAGKAASGVSNPWVKQIGLELYTVRDLTPKDYEGTLAKVSEIGFREVEPATNYGDLNPKQFRAMLDRYGLSMPSTHVGAVDGPDLESQLEGFQVMGIHYTEIRGGGGSRPSPQAPRPAITEESVKRSAQEMNRHGAIAKKFGMKILVHNHAQEFQAIPESSRRPYDVLLAETDPALVAMQLDIGWASVAGQNILEMFKKNPGRFELWHVKDAKGIKNLSAQLTQTERMHEAMLLPVGLGDVNYKPIFAAAGLAGLKHFCIEQDNAADWGDSLAAARISYQNLGKLL